MYLSNLHIKNLRCFEDTKIEFSPKLTCIAGINGSGKSTILKSISKSLGKIVSSFSDDFKISEENFFNYDKQNNEEAIEIESEFKKDNENFKVKINCGNSKKLLIKN